MTPPLDLGQINPVRTAVMAVCNHQGADVTFRQVGVLITLFEAFPAGLRTGEIATKMAISKPAVTRAIDRLEADGLVVNSRGSNPDRRLNSVMVTPDGILFLAKMAGREPAPAPARRKKAA